MEIVSFLKSLCYEMNNQNYKVIFFPMALTHLWNAVKMLSYANNANIVYKQTLINRYGDAATNCIQKKMT